MDSRWTELVLPWSESDMIETNRRPERGQRGHSRHPSCSMAYLGAYRGACRGSRWSSEGLVLPESRRWTDRGRITGVPAPHRDQEETPIRPWHFRGPFRVSSGPCAGPGRDPDGAGSPQRRRARWSGLGLPQVFPGALVGPGSCRPSMVAVSESITIGLSLVSLGSCRGPCRDQWKIIE